ncbi:glycosyltransferase family 4 protein [Ammonicoccus fulvus]|uniref:Glycosyltransferase family 4 protein n=1 Tax=Ammonicoccus fulvus TaxID=3138240 RepID=A0ABZ3FUP8_9ACTN
MTSVLRLLVPDQAQISGGGVFNARLAEALTVRGWAVDERRIAGDWPSPEPEQRAAVAEALRGEGPALVDGLIGSVCPDELEAAVAAGVSVIVLVHLPLPAERGLPEDEQARLAASECRALHAATAIAVPSHWASADLARRYDLTAHVVVPGVEPAPVAEGSEPPQLLMLAALTPVKNHATLLAALGCLGDLDWQATLAGPHRDPQTVAEVRRLGRTAAVEDRITLPGELTGTALDTVWQATDLLLVPSWTETYGLVVTEALARGIPAIVARGTGAAEALAGGPGVPESDLPGALADPGDPAEWARLVRGRLTDPVRRDRWRRAALERRESLRTWSDAARDLECVLEELS